MNLPEAARQQIQQLARNAFGTTSPTLNGAAGVHRGVITGIQHPRNNVGTGHYTVQLDGAIKAVLHNVPIAAPVGGVTFNGATVLNYLNIGDLVLVAFSKGTLNPVIINSLSTSQKPGMLHKPDQRTDRETYVQPFAPAIEFSPAQLHLGFVKGEVTPLLVRPSDDNEINPHTLAGIQIPGAFSFTTPIGGKVEYIPGDFYRVQGGRTFSYIPGFDAKTKEEVQKWVQTVQDMTSNLDAALNTGGRGIFNQVTGNRQGPYVNQNEKELKPGEKNKVKQEQNRYVQEILRRAQEWENFWKNVENKAIQIKARWNPSGFGIQLTEDQQPQELDQVLQGRPVPEATAESGSTPSIFADQSAWPPIVHSEDIGNLSGKKAQDAGGVVQKGVAMLEQATPFLQQVMQALAGGRSKKGETSEAEPKERLQNYRASELEGVKTVAVLLHRYNLPQAPELTAQFEWVCSREVNLIRLLDFYFWIGNPRVSIACVLAKLMIQPQGIHKDLQELKKMWPGICPEGELPDYIEEKLKGAALGKESDRDYLYRLLQISPPDFVKFCQDPWEVGVWLGAIDERLKAISDAFAAQNPAEALLAMMSYGHGVDWQLAPQEVSVPLTGIN